MEAYIYKVTNSASFPATPLKIDDKNIGFLTTPLMSYSKFKQNEQGNWQLTFFADTPFEISLRVDFKQDGEGYKGRREAQGIWIDRNVDIDNIDDLAKQTFATISQYIRGSSTLEAKQFIETTNNRCFVADRDSIGYVANSKSQFERVMLCLSLAVAYRSVIHDFMNEVTQATNSENIDQLLVLYRQILSFNAGNYFRYPVDLNSHELRIIWDTIHKNWCLQELNQELTNQLTAVAELLRAEQDRKDAESKEDLAKLETANAEQQAERENSFNRKATIAGVFLGVLSILALVELTPQHFTSAYNNWLQPIVNTVVTTSQAETKK